jgi:hypothetical protein
LVVTERIAITIDELALEPGADVAEAVRGELEGHPVDAARVAEAVATAVETETNR